MPNQQPKWLTPARQSHLIDLFRRSRGFCVFQHERCPIPEHHYPNFIEDLIADWISEDKAERAAQWQAERLQLHALGERHEPLRGRFSNISQDIFYYQQPPYYIQGYGVSGLTLKPFAKVRLSSSYVVLFVELDKLTDVSKSRKRKAFRYGKRLPQIEVIINQAVRDYLK